MPRTLALAVALALLGALPRTALALDSTDRTADQLFGYTYGEAPPDARRRPSAESDNPDFDLRPNPELDFSMEDDPREGNLHLLGIAGMGTGGSLLALGGLGLLSAQFTDDGTTHTALKHGGLTLIGIGGALFLTGVVLFGVHSSRAKKVPLPAPTADGRGAQLLLRFDF